MQFDLTLEQLQLYRGSQDEPHDFRSFWDETLREARQHDLAVRSEPVGTVLTGVSVADLTFRGFGGADIRAWVRSPSRVSGPLPAIVEFVGYGGGRGRPEDSLFWAACGFVHIQMDNRGQGSAWSEGHTPDPVGAGPHIPGMMTAGIEDPTRYYYRRLITDAVRATEAAATLPGVDPDRIHVHGASQGGGLALAVAALAGNVAGLFSCVPFLCDLPRAIRITDADPYAEIARYLAVHRTREAQVLRTLSYFDGATFARHAHAPAIFTTALMDVVCPPSTVFAAYNSYAAAEKRIWVHPYNGHEGGGTADNARFVREVLTGQG